MLLVRRALTELMDHSLIVRDSPLLARGVPKTRAESIPHKLHGALLRTLRSTHVALYKSVAHSSLSCISKTVEHSSNQPEVFLQQAWSSPPFST